MHQLDTTEGRDWIVSHLKMGPVKVTFTKRDGSERVMLCTLQEGVAVPYEKKTDRESKFNQSTLAVWDIDKSEWRSFKLDSVKQIEFGF